MLEGTMQRGWTPMCSATRFRRATTFKMDAKFVYGWKLLFRIHSLLHNLVVLFACFLTDGYCYLGFCLLLDFWLQWQSGFEPLNTKL